MPVLTRPCTANVHGQVVVDQGVLTSASSELTIPEASAIADKTLQYTVCEAFGAPCHAASFPACWHNMYPHVLGCFTAARCSFPFR